MRTAPGTQLEKALGAPCWWAVCRHLGNFGVATECGLGRRPRETIAELLRMHAASASTAGPQLGLDTRQQAVRKRVDVTARAVS
jgi:hypothetical protein